MARLKHFRKGDRVQGARRTVLGFFEKPGTIVDVLRRERKAENERYLVHFDCFDDPVHSYWFNREELKELETDE